MRTYKGKYLYDMIKSFLFQQVSKLKQESSLRMHMFAFFNLIFLKQQLFLNVLNHINVAYEYMMSITPERKQTWKSETCVKFNFLILSLQSQTCESDIFSCTTTRLFFFVDGAIMRRYITQTGHACPVTISFAI